MNYLEPGVQKTAKFVIYEDNNSILLLGKRFFEKDPNFCSNSNILNISK